MEREKLLIKLQCLENYLPILLPIIIASISAPRTNAEVDAVKQKIIREIENVDAFTSNDQLINTAFGEEGLGMPLKGATESIQQITADKLNSFIHTQICTPRIAIAANGIENHAEIEALIKTILAQYNISQTPQSTPKSTYKGGYSHLRTGLPHTQATVGFPCSSWADPNFPVFSVLQTIVGDATSFSQGGPGKGMHARAPQRIFRRHSEIESCKAIRHVFQDGGLFGLQVEGDEANIVEMVKTSFIEQYALMQDVTNEEVSRAKNILKINVLNTLSRPESRTEEMARNMQAFGKLRLADYIKVIDEVTVERVVDAVRNMLRAPPTISIIGGKSEVYNDIMKLLNKA